MSARPDLHTIWQHICDAKGRVFMQSDLGTVNYATLAELVGRFCAAFDKARVGPGGRVVILTVNEPVAGAAFVAAMLDGLVPVMLPPDSRPARTEALFASIEPGLLIADEAIVHGLPEPGSRCFEILMVPQSVRVEKSHRSWGGVGRMLVNYFKMDASVTVLDLPASAREPRLPSVDETLAYILFTSGTTTAPCGVQISRRSLMAHLQTLARLFEYDSHSRIFNATPLSHTDGLVQGLLLAVANAATLFRPGRFSLSDLEEWLNCLGRFKATHFITNPTVLALIDRFASHNDYFDDPNFFGVLSSASILRPDLWARFEARFGCDIYNMYGMTETVANATYAGRHPEMGPVGTIGVPIDCEVRLVEPGAQGVGQQASFAGELQIKGENVFLGYWKNPDRTAQTLETDGWMHTGDLARQRDDGGLEIIGRIKTMINMGGQSVMPEEINEALAAHPAVVDVATVGVADPEFEEVAISAVVLEQPASEFELAEHSRAHLERLKVPKRIIALEKIPRGDAGKPRMEELHSLLNAFLGSEAIVETGDGEGPISAQAVYEMAADVFRVAATELSSDSSPDTVAGWDSFTQLSLVIEAESRFGFRISASQVAKIRTLGELHLAITAKR